MDSSTQNDFDDLVDRYCAGLLDQESFTQLQTMLRDDVERRRQFRETMATHAALNEIADTFDIKQSAAHLHGISLAAVMEPDTSNADRVTHLASAEPQSHRLRLTWLTMVITCAASLGIAIFSMLYQRNQGVSTPAQLTESIRQEGSLSQPLIPPTRLVSNRSIALIKSAVDVNWARSATPLRVGEVVPSHVLNLESGILEIVFLSGAMVVVEGPAKLDLVSEEKAVLHNGKVRCYVPPAAVGFSIETRDTTYMDMGTEFGVEIKPDGKQELHVFDGEVHVHSRLGDDSPQMVSSGEGLRQKDNKEWKRIESDTSQFTNNKDLSLRKTEQEQKSYQVWSDYRKKIQRDKDLVLFYDFDSQSENPQLLKDKGNNAIDGSIVGCEVSTGRWELKPSLEFKKPSDRVRLNIPGEFDNVTMTTWLRLDGFDRHFNSIFLTDRYDDGHLHWQVKWTGEIDAGIKVADSPRRIFVSEPVLSYEDLGRWIHLAVVVDKKSQSLSHYLDGKRVARFDLRVGSEPNAPQAPVTKIRFGKAELGNWSPERKYDNEPVRNLNGRIDEFAMFGRALSDFEIRELYNQSRPH
ncbi:FecR protein domain protein [Rhodopirellula maiorica SM1]|uniref:FecR protein domain protein n=1 Tax=Rhodopirellula maiorica SM1 TaxID=1265738 RepID=M5RIH1_9BACT|nr:LamG domain-containing protein [Rhodopirellula maiorica]EMI19100.1 FecR protein domain protein [Rhodopirellula maiorica SM1]